MPARYQLSYDPRHLVSFAEVAQRLHFRQAAESLALAQPALSRQIRQLEDHLGTPLFSRGNRKVELTSAGRVFLDTILPALELLQGAPAKARAAADGSQGILRIHFTGLAMATVLPQLLRGYTTSHPAVRVELTESPTSRQLSALVNGDIDAGFIHPDAIPAGIETRLLLSERNGVVLASDHPLAMRRRIRLSDLRDTPLVLFPRSHNPSFHDRILNAFAASGITPRITEEVWPRSNAVGLVRAGLGATLMCPSEAHLLPGDVIFRPLSGPAPESRLALAWKRSPTPTLAAFLATLP
jgi:DNA-binding transcriptional LysR family regulator